MATLDERLTAAFQKLAAEIKAIRSGLTVTTTSGDALAVVNAGTTVAHIDSAGKVTAINVVGGIVVLQGDAATTPVPASTPPGTLVVRY